MIHAQSDRLILRNFQLGDLKAFFHYARKPSIGPNAGWKPHETLAETQYVLNRFIEEGHVWAVVYRPNHRLIGSIGLHKDPKRGDVNVKMLGYVLDEPYWGRGLATEAARLMVAYAFERTDIELLSAYHYTNNARSRRVIEKCGFHYEGTLRLGDRLYVGRTPDEALYSLTRQEYMQQTSRPSFE